jgi:hypothetical protein
MNINTNNTKNLAREAIRKYPHLKDAVTDAFELMIDEIADGSSDELEQERFLEELDYLIAKEK